MQVSIGFLWDATVEKINATVSRRSALRPFRQCSGYNSKNPSRDFCSGTPERKCRDILFLPAGILCELRGLSLILQAGGEKSPWVAMGPMAGDIPKLGDALTPARKPVREPCPPAGGILRNTRTPPGIFHPATALDRVHRDRNRKIPPNTPPRHRPP